MPRNASGTYTLPTGNPVVSGTLIEADWANTTLNDIANELTDSLSRSGEGGMLAPFRLADGLQASPGIAWLNEPSTGFYREGSGEMWGVVGGAQILQYTSAGVLVPTGKTLTANGGTTTTTLTTSGAATLASASVTGNLSVGGTLTLTGGLTLNGNVTVGDSSADTLTINSTITSNLIFTDNTYDIGASGATRPRNLYLAGDGVIGGTLGVTGVLTASGGVTGNLTGNVTGNVTGSISGGTVAGTTGTFSSNVTVGGTLGVTGATTLSSTLGVTGAITASGGVNGNVTGNLTGNVTGSISGGTVAGSTGAFSSNVTVGGTLGVTGVATLTVNPVLSAGTANGVLYLNGSKEATSGSALTFDGTSLGLGVVSTTWSNGTSIKLKSNGAGVGSLGQIDSNIFSNAYYDGGWKYFTSAKASVFENVYGSFLFKATPSVGTANNAITFTTLMELYSEPSATYIDFSTDGLTDSASIWTTNSSTSSDLSFRTKVSGTAATRLKIDTSGVVTVSSGSTLNGGVVVNESGADVDFRIESDTNANAFFLDGATGNVGIGTSSPTQKLNVNGIALFEGSAQGNIIIQKTGTNGFSLFSDAAGKLGFYDQNGAATRMLIDSSGNVGIGTSSPLEALHITTGGSATTAVTGIKIQNDTDLSGENIGISFGSPSWPDGGEIYAEDQSNDGLVDLCFALRPNGGGSPTERMRLDYAGRLGLGVTPSAWGSTYKAIDVNSVGELSATSSVVAVGNNRYIDSGGSNIYKTSGFASAFVQVNGQHIWYTAPSGTAGNTISFTQAMTLDASGNLLVGKTSSNFGTAGVQLQSNGELYVTRSGGGPVSLNRLSTDGGILFFAKDGTTVGSIGTASSYLTIGSPVGSGSYLLIGNNLVHPATSAGGAKDNAIDIGGSSNRFKDLYLSGGVYLGGTVAANQLDDYEEGTWTPVIAFGGSSSGITYGAQVGRYTKVGRLVTLQFFVLLTNKGAATGNAVVSGVPSVAYALNTAGGYPLEAGCVQNEVGGSSWPANSYGLVWNDGNVYLRYNNGTGYTAITDSEFTNTTGLYMTVTYEIAP